MTPDFLDTAIQTLSELHPIYQFYARVDEKIEAKNIHHELKDCLLKLGKILGFETKTEFPCDNFKLDVVWCRKPAVNPTHCFEVLVSGNLPKDLTSLRYANDRWKSNIYLVCARKKDLEKCNNLLAGAFHEIREKVGILDAREVMEYCRCKEKFKNIDELLFK